jgi:hypothetical protein
MSHKLTIADVRRRNGEAGRYFFSPSTMKFFASKVESTLYKNLCFVTSEKKCFEDYTRVFHVRRYDPFTHDIETLGNVFMFIDDARKFAREQE